MDISLIKALSSSASRCSFSLESAPDFPCGQSQWPTSRLAKRRGSDKVQPNRYQGDARAFALPEIHFAWRGR
jgi:hypothetical protein